MSLVGRDPVFEGSVPSQGLFQTCVQLDSGHMWLSGLGYWHKEAIGTSLTLSPCAARAKTIPGTFPCPERQFLMIFCWENSFLEELPAGSVCYCSSQCLLSLERNRDRAIPFSQAETFSTNTSLRLWWCSNFLKSF